MRAGAINRNRPRASRCAHAVVMIGMLHHPLPRFDHMAMMVVVAFGQERVGVSTMPRKVKPMDAGVILAEIHA